MARSSNNGNSSGKVSGKIRFIMLEADIEDGNLTEIAQAISAAVRPANVIQRVVEHQSSSVIEGRGSGAKLIPASQSSVDEADSEEDTEDISDSSLKTKRVSEKKKPFKGEIDDSILWDGDGTPFVEYMKQRNPQDTAKKFLIIAAWFKRFGGKEAINSNLAYNAYRKMGWGALVDMNQPFRDGAKSDRGYYKRDVGEGNGFYAITNIGLDAADRVGDKPGGD